MWQTLEGSLSDVSKPTFANKLCSIFRDLMLFAVGHVRFFGQAILVFSDFAFNASRGRKRFEIYKFCTRLHRSKLKLIIFSKTF